MTAQHAGLSPERWAQFPVAQQILMIANEMHRASKFMSPTDAEHRTLAYERVLRLTDLTIEAGPRRELMRELLRWRDLVAARYVDSAPEADAHRALLRVLLLLDPQSATQLPHVG